MPDIPSAEVVRLIYQNGEPVFEQGKSELFCQPVRERFVVLDFGVIHADIDNIAYPSLTYFIHLVNEPSGWKAVLGEPRILLEDGSSFLDQQPAITVLVEEINRAIRARKKYAFSTYQSLFDARFGRSFRIYLTNRI